MNCALSTEFVTFFKTNLKGVDGINLCNDDAAAEAAQGLSRPLADVPVAGDERHLARQHDVRGALDSVHQRLSAPVQVVEFALRHAVVHVDGGDLGQLRIFTNKL